MAEDVFRYESKRVARARRVQTAQHVVAAFLLIAAGWEHLSGAHGAASPGVLPYLEVAAGAALVAAAALEKLRKVHAKVAIVELAGAAMLFVEAFGKLRQKHHTLFYVLTFIQPCLLLAFALFDEQLRAVRAFRATDEALTMRTRFFRRRSVPWRGIRSYRLTESELQLLGDDGRTHRLPLRDVANRAEALTWLSGVLERKGIAAER